MESLKDAVTVLAADAETQLDHLRKLGLPACLDEIALEYDDIARAADDMLRLRELDQSQYDSVKKLHGLLSRMSGQANSGLWTADDIAIIGKIAGALR